MRGQEKIEGKGGNEREGKMRGLQRVGSHPHVRNPEKYPDCRTDLNGRGGNTDICPGWQTPSRCHCTRRLPHGDAPCTGTGVKRRIGQTAVLLCQQITADLS